MNNFINTEYLQCIYDSLIKDSVNTSNASELTEDLLGMYDGAFEENVPMKQRLMLLKRFALFALLKKEVRISFVAEVLEESASEILEFITSFSDWFNSSENSKYQLHHERLKVKVLEKISEKEIHALQEKLIARLKKAIKAEKADEFELYGLEFLANHLLVDSMYTGQGVKLIEQVYSQRYCERQLIKSKGYEWTKNGLKAVMHWASKFDDVEVLKCSLKMVDLYHQEQNDASQIVQLVAEGNIDSALERIVEFGGSDKEGLKRKFTVYMLCMMELTLLDSKNKPFRKEGIEKILKQLDNTIPVDKSLLSWNSFFPSYSAFQVACELANLELDYLIIYRRTERWDSDWITQRSSISEKEIAVLSQLMMQLGVEEQCILLVRLSIFLMSSNLELAEIFILKALKIVLSIENSFSKDDLLKKIGVQLIDVNFISEAIEAIDTIDYQEDKMRSFMEISIQLAQKSKFEKSLLIARNIQNEFFKYEALKGIGVELGNKNFVEESNKIIRESLEVEKLIEKSDEARESKMRKTWEDLEDILSLDLDLNIKDEHVPELNPPRNENVLQSEVFIKLLNGLKPENKSENSDARRSILICLAKKYISQGHLLSALILSKTDNSIYENLVEQIISEYLLIDDIESAVEIVNEIPVDSNYLKFDLTRKIYLYHFNKSEIIQCKNLLLQAYAFISSEKFMKFRSYGFTAVYGDFILINEDAQAEIAIQEAIQAAWGIDGHIQKQISAFQKIIYALILQDNIETAVNIALQFNHSDLLLYTAQKTPIQRSKDIDHLILESLKGIRIEANEYKKISHLKEVSILLLEQGKLTDSYELMQEAWEATTCIEGFQNRSRAFILLAVEIARQGNLKSAAAAIEEALKAARTSSDEYESCSALLEIVDQIGLLGNLIKEDGILQEVFDAAQRINKVYNRSYILGRLASYLVKKGAYSDAERAIHLISEEISRCDCWKRIGEDEFKEKGYFESLKIIENFTTIESQKQLKIGVISTIDVNTISSEILVHVLKENDQPISSIEHILKMYALNQLFFGNLTAEQIKSFNKTFNIQWAMNVKKQVVK